MSNEKVEKQLDKSISFHKAEMRKMRKQGRLSDWAKHSTALDLAYELKRNVPEI